MIKNSMRLYSEISDIYRATNTCTDNYDKYCDMKRILHTGES